MTDCIFCQIITREAPASIFYEDDLVLGFMDIQPVTTGHVMVIPKKHGASLAELDEETGKHMFTVAQRVAAALRKSGVKCEGVNLFLADGEAAFQDVFHVHLHVIPRYKGDSFKISADWSIHPPREELDLVAAQIKGAYDGMWS